MPPLTNPDDCEPSKSFLKETPVYLRGTETFMEVRSEWEGAGTMRIGELRIFQGTDTFTVRLLGILNADSSS